MGETFVKIAMKQECTESDTAAYKAHFKTLCDMALVEAAKGKNVAISFVAYQRWIRDYIRELIPGIKIANVQVDIDILLPKNISRIERAMA